MLENIENLLKKLKKDDLVCIIHHDDGDGISSSALFSILIQEMIGSFPLTFPVSGANEINRGLLNSLKMLNPEMVVVLDLPVNPKRLNLFSGFILDHHVFEIDETERRMMYFNPRFFENDDDKVVPTSYMVYRILKDLVPEEKISWVAGIGITEDHRVELCKEVFENIIKEYPDLLNIDEITQEKIENNIFGKMWDMVRSGRMVRGSDGAKTATLALIECKNRPDQFINGLSEHAFMLKVFYERVLNATQNSLKELETSGNFFKDKKVIVYEPKNVGLSGLTSFISDKIRHEYPDWITCVINKTTRGGKAKVSIRAEQTKRNVDLVEVLKKISKKIPSMKGGGHKSAVGLNIDYKDLDKFFEEFLKLI